MVNKIKSEWVAVNPSKMWIKFTDEVKNFHIMDLKEILRIGLVKWREIGWGSNQSLVGNVKC